MKNKEIWRNVKNYEGLYKISNIGRIKSLNSLIIDKKGRAYRKKEMILKQRKDKYGYNAITRAGEIKANNLLSGKVSKILE